MSNSRRIDLPFVLEALRRFRHRAVTFLVIAVGIVIAGVLLAPRQYSSEARLFLRVGRESGGLDATATIGDNIAINDNRLNEVNSALEMLKSRELCVRVVDRLGPQAILDPPAGVEPSDDANSGPSVLSLAWTGIVKRLEAVGILDPVDAHERAIKELGEAMQATVPKNTCVITVTCRSATPENAQKIVAEILACYAEMHLQAHRTPQSYEFFIEQSDKLHKRIQADNEILSKRKNELGLVTLEGQRLMLETERSQVEQQLSTAQGQLAASKAKLQSLDVSLKDLPQREITEKVDVPNLATDNMRQLLYQLEIQEREQSALLSENHPKLLATRQQLKDVKSILADQATSRPQTSTGLSPTRQPVQVAQLMEKSEVDSWEAKVKSLLAEQQRIAAAMKTFNDQRIEIERLERDLALADTDYRSYAVRREQARIDQVLAEERISNLNVVQPPSLVRKPVSPKKLLTIGLGFLGGICGAVCLAIMSARLDPTFRVTGDLESELAREPIHDDEFGPTPRPRSLAEVEARDHAAV